MSSNQQEQQQKDRSYEESEKGNDFCRETGDFGKYTNRTHENGREKSKDKSCYIHEIGTMNPTEMFIF